MEQQYNGHVIVLAAAGPNTKFKWTISCIILEEHSRKPIKNLDWTLDYDSREEAERAGLLIAKKWIDERKAA